MKYLEKYNAMKSAIAECHKIDEIKLIRDKAEAIRYALIQAKESPEWIRQAEEIKLRAERKAGKLIPEQITIGTKYHPVILSDLKITPKQSSNWQNIADIPEEQFENYIQTQKEITTSGAVKIARKLKILKQREDFAETGSKIKIDTPLICGDFYTSDIKENSIDLILTDPPYSKEFLPQWEKLGEFANRVLKPSKFLVAYSGILHLNETIQLLNKNMIYYWTFALIHKSNKQLIMPRNLFCGWKPLLIFQKKPFKKLEDKFEDIVDGSGREKNLHDWAQAENELDYIIKNFTIENDIILDPFAGSGTTLLAAKKNNRNSMGVDVEEENINIIKHRLSNV